MNDRVDRYGEQGGWKAWWLSIRLWMNRDYRRQIRDSLNGDLGEPVTAEDIRKRLEG